MACNISRRRVKISRKLGDSGQAIALDQQGSAVTNKQTNTTLPDTTLQASENSGSDWSHAAISAYQGYSEN